MAKNKISIIVPVYKVEKYLDTCVYSLLNQTYTNFEIILINDGSPDSCPQKCDMYSRINTKIKVVHQENCGLPAARNSGLNVATGDWILFVDGDDWISYDALEILVREITEEMDVIFFGYKRFKHHVAVKNAGGTGRKEILNEQDFLYLLQDAFSPFENHCKVFSDGKVTACTKLYNHKFLQEHRLRFFPEVKIHEDIPFAMSVFLKAKKGLYIDQKIYCYRWAEGSITNSYRKNYNYDLIPLINKLELFSSQLLDDTLAERLFQERICVLFIYIMKQNFCSPQNPDSYKKRKADCWKLRDSERYSKAIEAIHLNHISFKKRIMVWCIKQRCFWIPNVCFRYLNKIIE